MFLSLFVNSADAGFAEVKKMNTKQPEIKQLETKQKQTPKFMTKYERVALIGTRATQISHKTGAPITIDLIEFAKKCNHDPHKYSDAVEIAKEELRQKTIPLQIRRNIEEGIYEDWDVSEFESGLF